MRFGKATLFALALVLVPALAFGGVSGTSSVDFGTGIYQGYWCYTIDFTWLLSGRSDCPPNVF